LNEISVSDLQSVSDALQINRVIHIIFDGNYDIRDRFDKEIVEVID
jgi:hypothetical protein